jgi:hypothetical protein
MKFSAIVVSLFAVIVHCTRAAELSPPAPSKHFTDFAGVTEPTTSEQLNKLLERFENDTSNQIVVVVFPKNQSELSIEQFGRNIFEDWHIGQGSMGKGVLVAVFIQDRTMRVEVGRGLAKLISDDFAKRIIDEEFRPRFKTNDYDAGLSVGVKALMQAARGDYREKYRQKVVAYLATREGKALQEKILKTAKEAADIATKAKSPVDTKKEELATVIRAMQDRATSSDERRALAQRANAITTVELPNAERAYVEPQKLRDVRAKLKTLMAEFTEACGVEYQEAMELAKP